MTFTVSFDPFHFLGLMLCAYLAGMAGSILGVIITAIFTPSLDGQKLYKSAGMMMAIGGLQPLKFLVAFIAAGAAMYFTATVGSAALWAMASTAVLGFLVMLLIGSKTRV